MATGNIIGKTNVPSKLIEYTGLSTYTADVTIDNQFYTFAVDVKRVPCDLVFFTNTLQSSEVTYNGSDAIGIDLSPIIINYEGYEGYNEEDIKKIFRKPTLGSYIEAPYVVTKEEKEPVDAYVDFSASGISNNSPIPANKFLSSFDDDLSSFIGNVDVVNLYANIYNEGDYAGSYMRLGSKNNLGSVTLYLNYTISSIVLGVGKYFTDAGNVDTNAQLFVNGQEVELSDEAEIVEQTITLNNPSSTITIENRRSSGNDKGRIFITHIGSGEGGTTYSEKQLAFKEDVPSLDNYVTTNTTQTIDADKTFDGDVFINGNLDIENSIEIRHNNKRIYHSNSDGILELNLSHILKYAYDEEEDKTIVTFPFGIVPQYLREETLGDIDLYFNYDESIVVDVEGNKVGDIETNSSSVQFVIPGNYAEEGALYFYDFVYGYGTPWNRMDYCKPTKLYKHDIKFIHSVDEEEEEDSIHLIVINNSREPYSYTFNEESINLDEIVLLEEYNVLSMYVGNDYERTPINSAIIFHLLYDDSQNVYNVFICDYNDILVWNICENEQDERHYYGSRIVDTVSQL